MSILRSALLSVVYDGEFVRPPYIDLVQSIISKEFEVSRSYTFFDGNIKREGIVYILEKQEVYWFHATSTRPPMLVVRNQSLRENIFDLLAAHPLYAKWFGY